jgi:hypothetical protein
MTQFVALKKPKLYTMHFVECTFPNGTLRLFEGSGTETLPGIGDFKSSDPDWGKLTALSLAERSAGAVNTGFQVTVQGGPLLLVAARNNASQGSTVRVWSAEVLPATGVQTVTLERVGKLNLAPIQHGLIPVVELECVTAIDYIGDPDEFMSLSNAGQKRIDPTDDFCKFMSESDRTLPWGGKDSPRPYLQGGSAGASLTVFGKTVYFGTEQRS